MQLLSDAMKFLSCAAAALALCSTTIVRAETVPPEENARSLAAAETAFAEESVARGMRTAFLHVLSDDAIMLGPDPQNARKLWEAKKESEAVLDWRPSLAVV